jgi:uncharacterized protein HemX
MPTYDYYSLELVNKLRLYRIVSTMLAEYLGQYARITGVDYSAIAIKLDEVAQQVNEDFPEYSDILAYMDEVEDKWQSLREVFRSDDEH